MSETLSSTKPHHSSSTDVLSDLRKSVLSITTFLVCLGIVAIYASSAVNAYERFGDSFHYLKKQMVVAIAGMVFLFCFAHFPFIWIRRLAVPFLLFSIFGLILVLIPGVGSQAKGATRWFYFLGFSWQPAEFLKLAYVIFLAKSFSRQSFDIRKFWGCVLPAILFFCFLSSLLLLQPDFGTSALLLITLMQMFFIFGMPWRYLLSIGGVGCFAAAGVILWAPYRFARILIFLNPWKDVQNGGFQIIQSYVGFQNGGLFGLGLGESKQKLYFLPEAHTDFILSVIGEELGLLGVWFVAFLFAYLVICGFRIASLQIDAFKRSLAIGITCLIGTQALLNFGVTLGVLPTKGMTLPFVSHGANSLFVFLAGIAILTRISTDEPDSRIVKNSRNAPAAPFSFALPLRRN